MRHPILGALLLFASALSPMTLRAGVTREQRDSGRPVSLLVLDFDGNGHQLTSAADGVMFDIDGSATAARIGWTARGADDAFLFLDTNGNGRVDSGRELLGDGWRLPDGSRSQSVDTTLGVVQGFLPPYTNPTPQGMGRLDKDDEVYSKIRVWQDSNHDGKSDPSELTTLGSRHVDRILLSFGKPKIVPVDPQGNAHDLTGAFFVGEPRPAAVQRVMTAITFARK